MRLSAVCKGGVSLETDTTDSLDIFLLQDFVISKATSASINGVSIMEKCAVGLRYLFSFKFILNMSTKANSHCVCLHTLL